jgi:hypothetical protein
MKSLVAQEGFEDTKGVITSIPKRGGKYHFNINGYCTGIVFVVQNI